MPTAQLAANKAGQSLKANCFDLRRIERPWSGNLCLGALTPSRKELNHRPVAGSKASETADYAVRPVTASRKRSDGFSIVTMVCGGTLFVTETPAPITAWAPIIVSPPKIVAFA